MTTSHLLLDPLRFAKKCWPHVFFYKDQRDIIYSVAENDETMVPAGNQLGKDFVAGFIAIWWSCRSRPARVVTTSVKFDQLNDVLWGEIRNFINTSKIKLPIHYNHMKIRQVKDDGTFIDKGELVGQVTNKDEALLGRHLPRLDCGAPTTLVIFDEASGIIDAAYNSSDTWAHRKLVIGNPYPTTNFFYRGVTNGDLKRSNSKGYIRKIIRITADDSPNVRLAKKEIAEGKTPSNKIIVPGVKDYATYTKHRQVWDSMKQTIQLDAQFYEGAEVLLFPPGYLDAAELKAEERSPSTVKHNKRAIGCDPAEGGDSSTWWVIDDIGAIALVSTKTPDTSDIPDRTKALAYEYNVPPEMIMFDRGGGGKQHADAMRKTGWNVQTVAFGESVTPEKRRGTKALSDVKLADEEKYVFKNRRAQMFGELSMALEVGFSIPRKLANLSINDRKSLRQQLQVIPKTYDAEGRLYLLPKNKRDPNSKETTLIELIGHSPDEADALAVAYYCLNKKSTASKAGAIR